MMNPIFEDLKGQSHGLDMKIIATSMGHYCGYVRIPEDHFLYEKEYSEDCLPRLPEDTPIGSRGVIALMCMGDGELISPDCYFDVHGGITFSGELRDEKGWWLGFDCAHAGDDKHPEFGESYFRGGVFREREYVAEHCEMLAKQISEIK